MKLYLIIAFLFVFGFSHAQKQIKELKSEKLSASSNEGFSDDWPNLTKYQQENKELPAPAQKENRVVFLGSSIFER